ncbi:hypothetical protein [Lichenicoccus sp.]|uniref:hypothetical protein n=1 Tax=Lichenicoccus sp. TaxID=2781899 RepID=UPI003D112373
MVRWLSQVLLALIVAWAMAQTANAQSMPMAASVTATAAPHCPICPKPDTAGAKAAKMPACHVVGCIGALTLLPSPALLPGHLPLRAAYLVSAPVRWTTPTPAPDPFPPRPVSLD